ncbi:GAF and ANTAR domain-containing protein [Nostocoides sp. HKS02]|uniref:GAF and ANTAR domain-containing protein n=1 Tax=Nostocoides sp. HKS02 TaxID=1813880 RepID=UPI0012B4ED7D|nr:GAF and ANTAR domain-containing protein [Tetrasphaera sp. HKS02]QGN57145.1 ANTAR domain-containing protein [Tetrasphaera sp. HKS02]
MTTISKERLAETLVQVADTLVDDFDLIDFLTMVTERAAELAGSSAAGLLLSDEHGQLQFMAASTESARVVELFQVQREEGPCQDCFRSGSSVSDAELVRATQRWPAFAPRAVAAGFRSVNAFPLRHHRTRIGALNLFDTAPRRYAGAEERLLQALADVATIGILQERAIRRGELLTEQLQRALNSRITIEQAKGALAQVHTVTPDAAFELLRDYSRQRGQRLTEIADAFLHDPTSHPGLTERRP